VQWKKRLAKEQAKGRRLQQHNLELSSLQEANQVRCCSEHFTGTTVTAIILSAKPCTSLAALCMSVHESNTVKAASSVALCSRTCMEFLLKLLHDH